MKKNVLALSITAAVLSLGLASGAQAMTGNLGGATAGTLTVNGDGVGQMLLVPYYTAQAENSTLLNLTNTDVTMGKAVKVRFRGAANSDDVYDFQVFMSPGDVWTASISKGSDGRAVLTTSDASCTKPAKTVLNATPFVTSRLDSTLTTAQKAAGTLEGYVEIFNMGDIPKIAGFAGPLAGVTGSAGSVPTAPLVNNPLYDAIKHISKVAPCSGAAWTALDTTNLEYSATGFKADGVTVGGSRQAGFLPPTTGLTANWTIINVVGAAAWSGQATAIQSLDGGDLPVAGNVVYWPQTGDLVGALNVNSYTADPLLRTDSWLVSPTTTLLASASATPSVAAGYYDLPDMSTPYAVTQAVGTYTATTLTAPVIAAAVKAALTANASAAGVIAAYAVVNGNTATAASTAAAFVAATPTAGDVTIANAVFLQQAAKSQALSLTASIAATSVTNEFLTDTAIKASTDWVFSMPTRRYSTSLNYAATGTDDGRRFTQLIADAGGATANGYFTRTNTLVTARQICVKGITVNVYDREESTLTASTDVVVSPSTPADPLSFCGEAAVLSVNNGGVANGTAALKATVAIKDLDVTYRDGWMKLSTPSVGTANLGLPVLGSSFERAFAGTNSFGATFAHRVAR